ncbi:hypothetical protein CRE_12351 [Caenorhabditis remanei]|uniref:F-box domain-containing protein n=1 Tax=Caenorhabditis remanei TaxID=31234 RepID=E3NL62_CAERE|nr:hypothetical protein CRE_12351 [Caenorhabditis remanei]
MSKPRTQPPLFYETAKCVALYLDPNLRFHLNQRCPSFRAIHRTQYMKIGKLRINHANFIMDEIQYRVGIVRKYYSGTTPQSVAIENERGGIQYDVDRYGIPTIPEGAQTREEVPQDEMIRASLERRLMQLERYEAGRHSPRYGIELERRNLELNSYGWRIWNQEPPFEQYLKLTVISGNKLLKEEFLSYNRNLKQANHYLLKKILGVDGKLLIWVLDYRGDSTTFTSFSKDLSRDFSRDFSRENLERNQSFDRLFPNFRSLTFRNRLTENPESVYVPLSDTTEVKVWWKETTDEEYCYRPFIAFIKVQERDPLQFKRNSRFQLYQRCPSFRTVHKVQAIRIKQLRIKYANFEMNGTIYRLGVLRKYQSGDTPQSIDMKNMEGGIQYDVDKYGIPTIPEGTQIDGEVLTDAEIKARLEENASQYEKTAGYRVRLTNFSIPLEKRKLEVRSYEMRMGNQDPPFDQFIQLTSDREKVEILNYQQTLTDARNYLLKKIIGTAGRVFIKSLIIEDHSYFFTSSLAAQESPLDHIWKPYRPSITTLDDWRAFLKGAVSLQTERLVIDGMIACYQRFTESMEMLKTVVSEDIVPLKFLKIPPQLITNDPIRDAVEFLCIRWTSSIGILITLPNKRVHLENSSLLKEESVIDLMIKWRQDGIPNGCYYSIGFKHPCYVEELLNAFRRISGARSTENPECVFVPLSDNTELKVYWEETSEEEGKYCDKPLIVKIKAQARQRANFC